MFVSLLRENNYPRGNGFSVQVTWPIKGNKLMRNFFSGTQRNEIHVLHLFEVIRHNPETPTTAEVGIEKSIGDLIFLRLGGKANQAHLL